MTVERAEGTLFSQPAHLIVCPIPVAKVPWWWVLFPPRGALGTFYARCGPEPFRELLEDGGPLRRGEVRLTGPGRLRFKGIIHVRADSPEDVPAAAAAIVALVDALQFRSVALGPLGIAPDDDDPAAREAARTALIALLEQNPSPATVFVVR